MLFCIADMVFYNAQNMDKKYLSLNIEYTLVCKYSAWSLLPWQTTF